MRWPLEGPVAPRPRDARVMLLALLLLVTAALAPVAVWARVAGAAVVVVLASALSWALWRARTKQRAPRGWMVLDGKGIVRVDGSPKGGSVPIVRWDAPFGLSVLANHARTRAVLAFTTPEQTRHVTIRLGDPPDQGALPGALARAITVPDEDLPEDGRAPLGSASAAALVQAVAMRSPVAQDRIYLSDPSGARIVLDASELRVGERVFDLDAPLEWRGLMFHESGGNTATIYQATWVRQGTSEVVLVSPMPAELSTKTLARGRPSSHSGTDLRLMRSLPDVPPPRELRVAIERLFMLPLRHALDRAPRISRAGSPSPGRPQPVQT
jgi:hypothetical protein